MRRFLTFLAVFWFFWGQARAELTGLGGSDRTQPVSITAQSVENVSENVVEALGNVRAEWAGKVLTTDKLTYDRDKNTLIATGSVNLSEAATGSDLKCDRCVFNLADTTAEADKAYLSTGETGYKVKADKLKRTGPNAYEAENAEFTVCDGSFPSWRVRAGRVTVELEGYLYGRNGVFYVESMPVTYLPFFFFPAKVKRQSGFLPPRVGNGSTDGIMIRNKYYWVVNESSDVLFEADYRSKKGMAESAELRYVLGPDQYGGVYLRHYTQTGGDDNAFDFKLNHLSYIRPDTVIEATADYTGDKAARADYAADLLTRGISRLENHVSATHFTGVGSLYGFARYTQSLTEPQEGVLETLPSVGIVGRDYPLLGFIHGRTDVSADRLWREKGLGAERLRGTQEVCANFNAAGLGMNAGGGYRASVLSLHERGGGGDYEKNPWHGAAFAFAEAFMGLERNFGAFDHILEPRLSYRTEDAGTGDALPELDGNDAYGRKETLTPRLVTRLYDAVRGADFLLIDVQRSLDLVRARSSGSARSAWQPWRASVEVNPFDRIRLTADGDWDPDAKGDGFARWSTSLWASDARGDSVRIARQYLAGQADYVEGDINAMLPRGIGVGYLYRMSVKDRELLEDRTYVAYRHQCWEATADYSRSKISQGGSYDHVFGVTISLTGLGKLGSMKWQ